MLLGVVGKVQCNTNKWSGMQRSGMVLRNSAKSTERIITY